MPRVMPEEPLDRVEHRIGQIMDELAKLKAEIVDAKKKRRPAVPKQIQFKDPTTGKILVRRNRQRTKKGG